MDTMWNQLGATALDGEAGMVAGTGEQQAASSEPLRSPLPAKAPGSHYTTRFFSSSVSAQTQHLLWATQGIMFKIGLSPSYKFPV